MEGVQREWCGLTRWLLFPSRLLSRPRLFALVAALKDVTWGYGCGRQPGGLTLQLHSVTLACCLLVTPSHFLYGLSMHASDTWLSHCGLSMHCWITQPPVWLVVPCCLHLLFLSLADV